MNQRNDVTMIGRALETGHTRRHPGKLSGIGLQFFAAPADRLSEIEARLAAIPAELEQEGADLDALEKEHPGILEFIVPTYRDLTADDGLADYGACLDKVTMLTADEYRETRDLHPAPEHWRWLITPDGTPASSGTSFVRFVYSDGRLNNYSAYNGSRGVRPALTLKSDILVSVDDQEDQVEEPEDMTPEQREMALYEKAVAKWGKRAQALKAIEEMSELSQAILKLVFCEDYGIGDEQAIRDNISMERADVEIMLNQLHVIFGDNSEMECKRLDNLESLLEG